MREVGPQETSFGPGDMLCSANQSLEQGRVASGGTARTGFGLSDCGVPLASLARRLGP